MSMSKRKPSGINSPGVREAGDGASVVQMTTRSSQLEEIADSVSKELARSKEDGADPDSAAILTARDCRRINGYMEQLRIIAAEVAAHERATAWQSKL